MSHFWLPSTARRRDRVVGSSPDTIAMLVALGSVVLIVALLPLPRASLLTAIPITALIATMLFIAELIQPRGRRLQAVAIGLYAGSIGLAASTGPALAGLVALAATSPLILLTSHPWAVGRRLLTDMTTSLGVAAIIWTIDHAGVLGRHDWPIWLTVLLYSIVTLVIVLTMRRSPGSMSHDWHLSIPDVGLLVAPIAIITVALNTTLSPNRAALTTAILLIIPLCLAVTAHLLNQSRQNASRAVETLVTALDHRHPDTSAHSARVYSLVSRMLDDLPGLRPAERKAILTASLIHDIGKVGTPDQALLKPGALTSSERDIMQRHVAIGEEILRRLDGLEATAPIVRHHHERWDGAGYPDGLAGPGIPFGARLIAVADTYDAMTHDRVYRQALGHKEALAELRSQRGRQFDPIVVDIFSRIIADELVADPAQSQRVAS